MSESFTVWSLVSRLRETRGPGVGGGSGSRCKNWTPSVSLDPSAPGHDPGDVTTPRVTLRGLFTRRLGCQCRTERCHRRTFVSVNHRRYYFYPFVSHFGPRGRNPCGLDCRGRVGTPATRVPTNVVEGLETDEQTLLSLPSQMGRPQRCNLGH